MGAHGLRNGAPWVREAVLSVLSQTAPDLELIVIDDATPDLLGAVRDARLRVERLRVREGLTGSLARALGLARAPLLARLDADDQALPERLERQRDFLDAHPQVGLLGTGAREVDASGLPVAVVRPPAAAAAIRRALIRRNPFVHFSVMARRDVVERAGGYDPSFPVAQDYDLWMRVSGLTRLANLPEPLVIQRLCRALPRGGRRLRRVRDRQALAPRARHGPANREREADRARPLPW
ncbi:MAG: glycosyltransferase [Candidatus Rokubacteria bacterium]|nr:glycosyltransferase [Candidatus Rokubacteria bacterium]